MVHKLIQTNEIFNNGPGLDIQSNSMIKNCVMTNNFSNNGTIFYHSANDGITCGSFDNCTFSNNTILSNGGILYNNSAQNAGGCIFNFSNSGSCKQTFEECIFSNNLALNNGGAVYNNGTNDGTCDISFTNCLFANNSVPDGNVMYQIMENVPAIL